jgi:Caspase domain
MARADEILADLQQAKNLRILVLDACRDNPFAEQLKRAVGQGRGINVGRGLAKMESPEGTIISYATQAGRTADDGDGRNSPYTTAFLMHIQDKDNIATVFQTISASVYEQTKGAQVPELSLSFFGEFYLNGKPDKPASPAIAALPADPCADAAEHWHSAESEGTINAFRDHLLRFPTCNFAGLAKAKIEELSKTTEAAKRMGAFDGTWIVKETRTSKPPFPAATHQYALQIKDGTLHTSYGDGKPGRITFDGKIETGGSANIAVDGLTEPSKDPLHRPPGTPFHYALVLQLKDSTGVGARTQTPWPCRLELSKLSGTDSPSSDADESSKGKVDEKRGGATAVVAPDQRDSGGRHGQPAGGGVSCSVMRGRCAVVCVANTGRADCASTVCVRLEQECMSTGCWNGRAFSGCGLAKR